MAISSDGKRLVTGSCLSDEGVRIWDLDFKKELCHINSPRIGYLTLSPDDRTLAVGCFNHNVILWDAASNKSIERDPNTLMALFRVSQWPVFEEQPRSVSTTPGEAVTLSVQVQDGDWSYQWLHKGIPIEGAKSSTLTLTNVTADDFGAYDVKVCPRGYEWAGWERSSTAFVYETSNPVRPALLCEIFLGIPGMELKHLKAAEAFQNNQPDRIRVLDLIAFVKRGPSGIGNESGHTIRGNWGKNPSTISKPIHLEAGKRYAIKALLKEDIKASHLAVTWQMPGDEPPQKDAPSIPGEYLEFEIQ